MDIPAGIATDTDYDRWRLDNSHTHVCLTCGEQLERVWDDECERDHSEPAICEDCVGRDR